MMFRQPVYIERMSATFLQEGPSFVFSEPDYKTWIPAVMRRRMSRMVRMGVASGLQCLEGEEGCVDAILTATGYGCLTDTENFMHSILDTDEQQPSPTSFIQSTFNTIGASIAILTDNHQYNNTYVHRGLSFESALLDAGLLLGEEANKVLVGATDEMTPTLEVLLGRMGNWRYYPPGEGAAFFLLSATKPVNTPAAEILGVEMITGDYNREQLQQFALDFVEREGIEKVGLIWPEEYKSFCGEYPTASSFALWAICKSPQIFSKNQIVLVCNSFLRNHSFILLKFSE